jgi:hypothetical protein
MPLKQHQVDVMEDSSRNKNSALNCCSDSPSLAVRCNWDIETESIRRSAGRLRQMITLSERLQQSTWQTAMPAVL